MIDQRVLDAIHALGRETDTPQETVEAVVQSALPSIRLVPRFPKEGETSRLGGCRIGGVPDLPTGVAWPRLSTARKDYRATSHAADVPLCFLMQINLAEIASADVANLLPKAGMLYFFFFHWHYADEPHEPDACYVLFHEQADRDLHRVEFPADLRSAHRFRGFDLLPCLEWTVLEGDDTNYELNLWEDLAERVAAVQGLDGRHWMPTPFHRMLGHPQVLQFWDLVKGEVLLLQLSSDSPAGFTEGGPYPETGMMWGDCGRIYFIIGEADLRSKYFDNVFAWLESQ